MKIDLADVRREMRKVVDANPNYVYNYWAESSCYYSAPANGALDLAPLEPGCGVGHALYNLGVPLAILREIDLTLVSGKVEDTSISELDLPSDVVLTVDARRWLSVFQTKQDGGSTWRQAWEAAETTLTST